MSVYSQRPTQIMNKDAARHLMGRLPTVSSAVSVVADIPYLVTVLEHKDGYIALWATKHLDGYLFQNIQ